MNEALRHLDSYSWQYHPVRAAVRLALSWALVDTGLCKILWCSQQQALKGSVARTTMLVAMGFSRSLE